MIYGIGIQPTHYGVFKATGTATRRHMDVLFSYWDDTSDKHNHSGLPKAVDDAIRALNLVYEATMVFRGHNDLKIARSIPVTLYKHDDQYYILCYRNYDGAFPEFGGAQKLSPGELAVFRTSVMASRDTVSLSLTSASICPVPCDFDSLRHETSSISAFGKAPAFQ